MKAYQRVPGPGERIKIVSAGFGAMDCNGKSGMVRWSGEKATNGISDKRDGFIFSPDGSRELWRIPFDTEYDLLSLEKYTNTILLDVSDPNIARKALENFIELRHLKPTDWTTNEILNLTAYCEAALRCAKRGE